MKKKTKLIIGGVVATALLGGAAFAAKGYSKMKQHRAAMQQMLIETDTNSDQAISKEELMTSLKKRFDAADGDKDASVTKGELVTMLDGMKEMPFLSRRAGRISDRVVNQFDLNEDGKVAYPEFEGRVGKFFAVADWNDDGKVERSEIRKLRMLRGRGHGKKNRRGGWFDQSNN